MGILTIMFWAANAYLPAIGQQQAVAKLFAVLKPVYATVIFILSVLAIYLYAKNSAIRVWISSTHLCIVDPTFGNYELKVKLQDIVEFSQTTNAGQDILNTGLILKDGSYKALVFNNYHLDRHAFFAALKGANPAIRVPENVYSYTITRPKWAKKMRAKLGLK